MPKEQRQELLRSFISGTSFTLTHCSLTKIPTDLYQWDYLTQIDLSYNKIKTLPKRITTFKNLESLNIAHNCVHTITPATKELPNLKELDISNNKFKVFPPVLSELKQLESLNISRLNHLLLGEYIEVPSSFQQLPNIRKLRLSDSFTGYSQGLPVNYSNFPNFKLVESKKPLNLNPLVLATTAYEQNGGSEGLMYLFAHSKDTALLQQLVEEQFYDAGRQLLDLKSTMLRQLPAVLEQYPIRELNLRGCYLGIEHYPIGSKSSRRHWALSKQTNVDRIFEALETHKDILQADLSRNRLQHLPKALFSWQQLRSLDLSHNVLTALSSKIEALNQLELLDLQHNNLKVLPSNLSNLQQLRWLNLSRNSLSHIPEGIGELSKLEELYFVNALQQPLLSNHLFAIPESWQGLRSLKTIHFYDDGLGQIEIAKAYEKRLRQLLPKDCKIHLSYD